MKNRNTKLGMILLLMMTISTASTVSADTQINQADITNADTDIANTISADTPLPSVANDKILVNQILASSVISTNGILKSGSYLKIGQSIKSPNGRYMLILQTDGNLVMYDKWYNVYWASNTQNQNVATVQMQASDGNLVIYDRNNKPVWASNTWSNPGGYLDLQDDANLVIYRKDAYPLWSIKSQNLGYTLGSGQSMIKNQWMVSQDGNYKLHLNKGNLELLYYTYNYQWNNYQWKKIWETGTYGQLWDQLKMKQDGNLVLMQPNAEEFDIIKNKPIEYNPNPPNSQTPGSYLYLYYQTYQCCSDFPTFWNKVTWYSDLGYLDCKDYCHFSPIYGPLFVLTK